jgi:hypothetical protein
MDPIEPVTANTASNSPPPPPRALNASASAGEATKDVPGPKDVHELLVGWAEGVSESHIVLPTMIDGVDERDLVRWVICDFSVIVPMLSICEYCSW